MKLLKRICSAAAALTVFAAVFSVMPKDDSFAATIVTVSPYDVYEINGGKFEGWGTSLCWWANRVGYSDTLAQQAADTFFSTDGLGLNIARFNIGGGDDPSHTHITRTDSNMPGYTKYNNGIVTYDWNADYNQRNVLRRCIKAAGDDMIVEMFSNSPPYYMTNSGCSSGAIDSGKNNLRDDKYPDFAEYLAEVTAHYENEWGIHVQSITPMNEPYTNYWGAYSNKQEGCHFDQGASMDKIYQELAKSLKKRGLNDIIISANDESVIDTQISSWNKMSADTKALIGRIDTHTYGGSQRAELKNTAVSAGRNLWMSEVDGGAVSGNSAGEMGAGLWLANRITVDLNELNSSAWILWQVIDNHISSVGMNGNKDKGMVNTQGGYWGLAVADHDNNKIILTKKYYSMGQFSRYIRPGMTMLKCSNNCVAAFDEKGGRLVIVATNEGSSDKQLTFDLSGFSSVGKSAQVIRTSNSENWKDVGNISVSGGALSATLAKQSVTTYIINGVKGGTALTDKIDLSTAKLSGSDSWKSDSSTSYHKAFDGSTGTFFDGVADGWVQADLDEEYDISALGYAPRSGYEYRMVDGKFLISTDGQNWSTLYTVNGKPTSGMHYITSFSGDTTARYIRYEVPAGAPKNEYNKDSSYCANIAEIALFGTPHSQSQRPKYNKLEVVSGKGSRSWKDNADTTFEKAYDGSSTFFDGLEGGYVQLDLGKVCTIGNIAYCPRSGYETRMIGGYFSVSLDGKNWTKIYTVENKPLFKMNYTDDFDNIKARYVRYEVPTGAPTSPLSTDDVFLCNVAEIAVYGTEGTALGDVNGDKEVSVADLVMLQKHLLGSGKLTAPENGDVNGDGSINVFDMIALRKLVLASSI
ncbi:MAG: discoidin domain-containing protein [Ruminococcus sp.]|uniref:discoidin domain-containing protein n=1 Tax=Ruminococcus sp. TaxID=41978 RepID=UPI0025FF8C40|nr:discoidin domain-containing protein [Ruminococcus sp.]MCR5599627.1 discoidin domain-containing protein [Ruminococcus sp.]